MKKEEFINKIKETPINQKYISLIKETYNSEIPEKLYGIISFANETIFLDDEEWRILDIDEIVNASKYYQIDLISKKLIPFVDVMDNNFIVYNLNEKSWAMYNIVDECLFMNSDTIESF